MPKEIAQVDVHSNSGRDQLMSVVERIEKLEEDKQTVADEIKDVYTEAKSTGYNIKVIRKMIARRKIDKEVLAVEDAELELYEGIFA